MTVEDNGLAGLTTRRAATGDLSGTAAKLRQHEDRDLATDMLGTGMVVWTACSVQRASQQPAFERNARHVTLIVIFGSCSDGKMQQDGCHKTATEWQLSELFCSFFGGVRSCTMFAAMRISARCAALFLQGVLPPSSVMTDQL